MTHRRPALGPPPGTRWWATPRACSASPVRHCRWHASSPEAARRGGGRAEEAARTPRLRTRARRAAGEVDPVDWGQCSAEGLRDAVGWGRQAPPGEVPRANGDGQAEAQQGQHGPQP